MQKWQGNSGGAGEMIDLTTRNQNRLYTIRRRAHGKRMMRMIRKTTAYKAYLNRRYGKMAGPGFFKGVQDVSSTQHL